MANLPFNYVKMVAFLLEHPIFLVIIYFFTALRRGEISFGRQSDQSLYNLWGSKLPRPRPGKRICADTAASNARSTLSTITPTISHRLVI
jgi:hypothetical protein